jgi:hypothetical protein
MLSLLVLLFQAQTPPKFMGPAITIIEPQRDGGGDGGSFPRAPATICVEAPPRRQCFAPEGKFGNNPHVRIIQLNKDESAILFSAESGGTSGSRIYFGLLRPGTGKDLDNLFISDAEVSNQSEHEFWNEPGLSDSLIFLMADYVWGPSESHYSDHRYMISTYVRKPSDLLDGSYYFLEDRYMTVRKYNPEGKTNILAGEKQEILTRLRRLKQH